MSQIPEFSFCMWILREYGWLPQMPEASGKPARALMRIQNIFVKMRVYLAHFLTEAFIHIRTILENFSKPYLLPQQESDLRMRPGKHILCRVGHLNGAILRLVRQIRKSIRDAPAKQLAQLPKFRVALFAELARLNPSAFGKVSYGDEGGYE